jgi:hypothetical protein
MDGELLIKYIPLYDKYDDKKILCVQNIQLQNKVEEWRRYAVLPAKIRQKVSLVI